jgi:hypothetical protein
MPLCLEPRLRNGALVSRLPKEFVRAGGCGGSIAKQFDLTTEGDAALRLYCTP